MAKQKHKPTPPRKTPTPKQPTGTVFPAAWLLALLALTVVVFAPMLQNQFTNWDDGAYVLDNLLLRGPDWAAIWSKPVVSNYHPLTVTSLALNYQFSRAAPFAYLLLNGILHLLNTALVFYLAWRLSERRRRVALFTALVFALHPMHVESVAWISERKDVLYTCFYLLALLRYLRYLETSRRLDYGLTLGFFALSLLSKPAAVALPLSLLAIDFWRGRSFRSRGLWLEKAPFLLLSLAFGLLTVAIQSEKALLSLENYDLTDRLFFGCYGLVMYAWRFVQPLPLSAFHPYPPPGQLGWSVTFAPVFLAALVAAVWYFRRNRALVFGAFFYAANVILVVQFIAIGNTLLSERYTYVPYIGLAFALAMSLAQAENLPSAKTLQWGLTALAAVVFGYLSWRQTRVWKNTETLWTNVVEHYPGTPIPHANRANDRYRRALEPANAAHYQTLLAQALADCDAALATKPDHFASLDIRSLIYLRTGRPDAALADATVMVQTKPGDKKGYLNRASALLSLKRNEEALADYTRCLERDPDNADAFNGRGSALFNGRGQYREALADFDRAIALKPGDGSYYLNRARCYLMLGDPARARVEVEAAQRLGVRAPKEMLRDLGM